MSPKQFRRSKAKGSAIALAVSSVALFSSAASAQTRLLGIDVSAWQGNLLNWPTLKNTNQRDFAFIRSSRGGTTGFYNQSDSGNSNGLNTLSQRYDDPYFIQNINAATNAGMLAGPYHFGRMDIIASTQNANGIPNNGTDEANHFIQMAGPWMRPGYLLPVFDHEAGLSQRTASELAQFAIDFSNRIFAVKQIRPAIYIGNNYANPMNNIAESTAIVAAYPTLWNARWPNQAAPDTIDVQGTDPGDYTPSIYGPWDNAPNPADPWHFWQYASTARLSGYNNGNSNIDVDVVKGGWEYLKDHLVPALWLTDSSGQWTTLTNWNSGETPIAPVQGPGQVARVGPLTLPTPRLPGQTAPGANDTVIIDRGAANPVITLASGTYNLRKLFVREQLDITGGSLTANYVPVAEAGPLTAQFSANVSLAAGASFSAHTLQVDAARSFNVNGGTVTLNTINLLRGATPAKINMGGTVTFSPLAGAAAVINSTGSGNNASIDLLGAQRSFDVTDGAASVDMTVNVPITNGTLYKDGAGTMQLGAANTLAGNVTINRGILLVTGAGQLGTTGVVTNMTAVVSGSGGNGFGGSLQLSNNVSYNLPMTIGGAGVTQPSLTAPGSVGALDSLSGTNTWAGVITLNGSGGSGTDPLENQIGARAGTLVLSGVIQNGPAASTWVKTGAGDVVLTGAAPNTYTNLTRLFGGRLIIEKDGALGGSGSTSVAAGNFFQNGGSASTLAFRAPASPGFFYSTWEVLNTESTGSGGLGQIDNLGGTNTFAGMVALGGPTVSGIIQSNLGVSVGSLELQGGLYARGTTGTRNITKTGVGALILSGPGGAATPNVSIVPLSASTFNISAGTLELRGSTPTTEIVPGVTTWNVTNTATLKSTSGLLKTNAANVHTGGLLRYDGGSMEIAALNLVGGNATVAPGGSKVLRTNSVTITGAAKADLGDNDLIVDFTASSPLATVHGYVTTGRNNGTWNGPGINTSQSAAPTGLTALGIAESSDVLSLSGTETAVWNGQSVDATAVLVMYTYGGDANLDGKLNIDDYTRVDQGIIAGLTGWSNGDFNYDGKVNIDDYVMIDNNLPAQGPPLNLAGGFGESVTAVPEPAGLLLLPGALVALRRRRRR